MSETLIIKNGNVVTPLGVLNVDIKIENEKIVSISKNVREDGTIINAKGRYVLPGAIDCHVHFQNTFGSIQTRDDFEGGTMAAAAGGVTTVVDYHSLPGKTHILEELTDRIESIKKQAIIDYGIHPAISGKYPLEREELKEVISAGFPSFKVYMTYEKQGLRSSDARLLELLKYTEQLGGLVNIHAENNDIVEYLTESYLIRGKTRPDDYPYTRPKIAEVEAIQRAILLTRESNSRAYIVHVSTGEGAKLIGKARSEDILILGETCPQYLLLTEKYYQNEKGALYICAPPLRGDTDRALLWEALASGKLQVVGSDHCGYSSDQKLGWERFDQVPPGLPGVETLLPLMFSEGVMKGRISIDRLVSVIATNPAKIFGLYPKKGVIAPGSDADLVIINPKKEVIIKNGELYGKAGYSPYDGWRLKGCIEKTVLRGRIIFDGDQIFEKPGFGEFVPRRITENIKWVV